MSNNSTNYTALGLAAAAGAVGALALNYGVQLLAEKGFFTSTPPTSTKKTQHARRQSVLAGNTDKRNIQVICFDMDGTLIETALVWYKLLESGLDEFGYASQFPHFSYDYWLPFFGQSMEQNIENWFPGLAPEKLHAWCNDNYHKYLDFIEVIEGAEDIVRFSNEITNNQCFITTNCPRPITELILTSPKCAFLKKYFIDPDGTSRIICPNDPSLIDGKPIVPKPSTGMVVEAAGRFKTSTHNVILVGDSKFDIMTINGAGGIGLQLLPPTHHLPQAIQQEQVPELEVPYLKITALSEIYQVQNLFEFSQPLVLNEEEKREKYPIPILSKTASQ